jgi:hypothetical protein
LFQQWRILQEHSEVILPAREKGEGCSLANRRKGLGRWISILLIIALMAGMAPAAAFADGSAPSIQGVVLSAAGTFAAGADVTVTDLSGGVAAVTATDAAGNFMVASLPDGQYTVRVQASGFQTPEPQTVNVKAGSAAWLTFMLTPETAVIRGIVADSLGTPLDGAAITVTGGAGSGGTKVTSADGQFMFGGLQPGTYEVSAAAPGFVPHTETLTLLAGEDRFIPFYLQPSAMPGSIAGTVTDSRGEPLAGASVKVMPDMPDASPVAEYTTAEDGIFQFHDLAAGNYTVSVSVYGYQPVFRTIVVSIDQPSIVNIALLPAAAPLNGEIQGTVEDAQNRAIAGAEVLLISQNNQTVGPVVTGGDGSFRFSDVNAGTYAVSVQAAGYDPAVQTATLSMEHPLAKLAFLLVPAGAAGRPGAVYGNVADARGMPVDGAQVVLTDEEGIPKTDPVLTRADGTYRLDNVPAGSYRLAIRKEGFAPYTDSLTVEAGLETAANAILHGAGSIRGVIRNKQGGPVRDADVTIRDTANNLVGLPMKTGEDGVYAASGLPEGAYLVDVRAAGYRQPAPASVTVQAGGSAAADFTLTGLGSIRGQVADGQGNLLAGAVVTVWDADGRQVGEAMRGSSFEMADMDEGGYIIRAAADGYSNAERNVTVVAGKVSDLDRIVLEREEGSLAGSVRDLADAAVAGARIALQGTSGSPVLDTVSDASGAFMFRDVPPGTYTLHVSAEGYAALPERTVTLQKGAAVVENIRLTEIGEADGQVITVRGEPVSGATVQITDTEGRPAASPVTTGADGKYVFAGLPKGSYTLTIRAQDFLSAERSVEVAKDSPSKQVIVLQDVLVSADVRFNGRLPEGMPLPGTSMTVETTLGAPELKPVAEVWYTDWLDEQGNLLPQPRLLQSVFDLEPDEAGFASFSHSFVLPVGAAELRQVSVRVLDGKEQQVLTRRITGFPLQIAAEMSVTVDEPAGLAGTGWKLKVSSAITGKTAEQLYLDRKDYLFDLPPSSDYSVQLVNSDGEVLAGAANVNAQPGVSVPVALTVRIPLQVKLHFPVQERASGLRLLAWVGNATDREVAVDPLAETATIALKPGVTYRLQLIDGGGKPVAEAAGVAVQAGRANQLTLSPKLPLKVFFESDAYFTATRAFILRAVNPVSSEPPVEINGTGGAVLQLPYDTEYTIELRDWTGKLLAQENHVKVLAGDETVRLHFATASLAIVLLDPQHRPVPDMKISVEDAATGRPLQVLTTDEAGRTPRMNGLVDGQQIRLKVLAPLPYAGMEPVLETMAWGDQERTIQLAMESRGTLAGKVLGPDGEALRGARVTATQQVRGQTVSLVSTTNADGSYRLDLYSAAPAQIRVNYHGSYAEGGVESIQVKTDETRELDLPLKGVLMGQVTVHLFTKYAGGEWEGPLDVDGVAAAHFRMTAVNRNAPDAYPAGYPFFLRGVPGDTVNVCVNGVEAHMPSQCQQAVFDQHMNAEVTIHLEQVGTHVSAPLFIFSDEPPKGPLQFVLYRLAEGVNPTPVKIWGYEDGGSQTAEFDVTGAGHYRLEVISPSLGMSGTGDFTAPASGTIRIPAIHLQDQMPFADRTGNGLAALSPDTVPGGTVSLRASYRNTASYPVANAVLELYIPEEASLVEGSVRVSGPTGPATVTSDVYSIPLGDLQPGDSGEVNYQLRLDPSYPQPSVGALVKMRHRTGGQDRQEMIGTAEIAVEGLTLDAPATVNRLDTRLVGRGPAGAEVEVYDDNMPVGRAVVSTGGYWQLAAELPDFGSPATHRISARTRINGNTLYAPQRTIQYDSTSAALLEITMQQSNGRQISLDPGSGVALFPYVYVPGLPFEFTLRFQEPQAVDHVSVNVGGTVIPAFLQDDGRYHATARVDRPDDIYVNYDIKPKPIDLDAIQPPDEAQLEEMTPPVLRDYRLSQTSAIDWTRGIYSGSSTATSLQSGVSLRTDLTVEPSDYVPTAEDQAQADRTGVPVYRFRLGMELTGDGGLAITASFYMPKKDLKDLPGAVAKTNGRVEAASVAQLGGMAKIVIKNTLIFAENPNNVKEALNTLLTVLTSKSSFEAAFGVGDKLNELRILEDMASRCTGKEAYIPKLRDLENMIWLHEAMKLVSGPQFSAIAEILAPATAGGSVMAAFSAVILADLFGKGLDMIIDNQQAELSGKIMDGRCAKPKDGLGKKVAKPVWIMDPSGYAYEGLESNRLRDVRATAWYKDAVTGEWNVWDAGWYGQDNPIYTDPAGRYAWDVPPGTWKVLWEKDGYQTADSPELQVPPPQYNVNVGMVSLAPPVPSVKALQDRERVWVEVSFSRYIQTSLLNPGDFVLSGPSGVVPVTITPSGEGTSPTGVLLADAVTVTPVVPVQPGSGTYTLSIRADGVVSYAGVPMEKDYSGILSFAGADAAPPALSSAQSDDAGETIGLVYSEALDASRTLAAANFTLAGTAASVHQAFYDNRNPQRILLALNGKIAYGEKPVLTVQSGAVRDQAGNLSAGTTLPVMNQTRSDLAAAAQISFSEGNLSPAFSKSVTRYTLSVAADVSHVQLRVTAEQADATIAVDGIAVAGDQPLDMLLEGRETIDIAITAQDRLHTMVYTVAVQRTTGDTPGNAPGGGGSFMAAPLSGETAEMLDHALSSVTTDGEGRRLLTITLRAETIHQLLRKNPEETEYALKMTGQADGYLIWIPLEAFAALAGQKAVLHLQSAQGSLLVPAEAVRWNSLDRGGDGSGGRIGIYMAALGSAQAAQLIREHNPYPGRLQPVSALLEFGVKAEIGGREAAVPTDEGIYGEIRMDLARLDPRTANRSGLYRLAGMNAVWEYMQGALDETKMPGRPADMPAGFGIASPGIYGVMSYFHTFPDIQGHWAQEAIENLAARHLIHGDAPDRFSPERFVSRAEFVSLLYRLNPVTRHPSAAGEFSDVHPEDWFSGAVQTAAAAGWIDGYADGTFRPGDPLTREQAAAMILRFMSGDLPHNAMEGPASLLRRFGDARTVSPWAREAVAAAVAAGLIQGVTDTNLQPQRILTRAEAAMLLKRLRDRQ